MASRRAKTGVIRAQQQQQQPPLSLRAPSNDTSPAPPPNPSLSATITEAHNGDPTHPRVGTVDASTMTDSVQEASSPAERQPQDNRACKPATLQPKQCHHLLKPPPKHLQRRTGHRASRPGMLPRKRHNRMSSWRNLHRRTQYPRQGLHSVTTEPNLRPKSRGPSVWNNDTRKEWAN